MTAPVVAVVCKLPLLAEAVCDALRGIADCRVLAPRQRDLAGLLRALRPDAVVVDDEQEATAAADFARGTTVPVVHVDTVRHGLRTLTDGRWAGAGAASDTPEQIRNVVTAELYGRRTVH